MDEQLKDAAMRYAAMGIAVHPLIPRDKRPATPNGLKDADTDVIGIEAWWTKHPDHNVGGAMGAPSGGIVAIDIDFDEEHGKDGYDFLSKWEAEHGELPETARAVTGRGGCHIFYRVNREIRPSVNSDIDIDIRGDGSYVMLAPSVHPNGNAVFWDCDPDEYGIAEATQEVYEFIDAVRPKNFGQPQKFKLPDKIKNGERNSVLYSYGCSMRSSDFDADLIYAGLETANKMRCEHPLPDDEVKRIANSVLNLPAGHSDLVKQAEAKAEAKRGRPAGSKTFKHAQIADDLIKYHGACYIDGTPAVRVGAAYEFGWDALLKTVLIDYPSSKASQRKEVVETLRLSMPERDQSPPNFIAFKNGVLDIETDEFWEERDDLVITNVIPHNWNPYAQCEDVAIVLDKMAADDPFIRLNLTETMGLCIYRSARYAYAPILLGSGSNGKSTYIDMIRAMVGARNISSIDLESLNDSRMVGNVAGKLANLGDDISADMAKTGTLAIFKKLTAGSRLTADVKYMHSFEFTPYCTMIFSCNTFPYMEKATDGEYRRLFPIEFNAVFSRDDPDYNPDIIDDVTSETACEYMLTLAVRGLKSVIANKGLTPNSYTIERLNTIRVDNDPILQWIEERELDRAYFAGMFTATAYREYEDWCRDSGVRRPVQRRTLSSKIRDMFGFRISPKKDDAQRTFQAFLEP